MVYVFLEFAICEAGTKRLVAQATRKEGRQYSVVIIRRHAGDYGYTVVPGNYPDAHYVTLPTTAQGL